MEATVELEQDTPVNKRSYRVASLLSLGAVTLLALWLLASGVKEGMANTYAYALRIWHERWAGSELSEQLNAGNLEVAEQVNLKMLEWQPNSPYYQTLAAKQLEWRNFYQVVLDTQDSIGLSDKRALNQANLEQAYWHYLQAAERRPAWVQTYLSLASNRAQAGADIGEWYHWLALAKQVAPAAKATLLGEAELGLRYWSRLDAEQQIAATEALLTSASDPVLFHEFRRGLRNPLDRQRACGLLMIAEHPQSDALCARR